MAGDDDSIPEQLKALTDVVTDVRETLRDEGEKRDKRMAIGEAAVVTAQGAADQSNHTARLAVGIAAFTGVVAVVAVIVAVVAVVGMVTANNDRKQRTVAACVQANNGAQNTATLVDTGDFKLLDQLGAAFHASKSDVDRAKAKNQTAVQKLIDTPIARGGLHRDCSPAGLRQFYSKTSTTVPGSDTTTAGQTPGTTTTTGR